MSRRQVASVALVAVLAAALANGGPASPAQAAPAPPSPAAVDPAMVALPEFPAMVAAFRRAHPRVSQAEAERRVGRQGYIVALTDEAAQRYPDTFGGAWYDGDADTLHVNVTRTEHESAIVALAARSAVSVRTHPVRYSLNHLANQRQRLNSGRHPALSAWRLDGAGINVQANRVMAVVSPDQLPDGRTVEIGDGIVVTPATPGAKAVATECLSRWTCGRPLSGGIALWRNQANWNASPLAGNCSLGYTATASDGTHWALTAGHCGPVQASCTASTCWRHGQQYIGAMRQTFCDGDLSEDSDCQHDVQFIDVGRIRVSNPYWLASTWGWWFPGTTPVDQRADVIANLPPTGVTVCLSAQWSAVGATCGTYAVLDDPDAFFMARVDGHGACAGDSGGGWYVNVGGERRAIGIQSLTTAVNEDGDPPPGEPGCRTVLSSWFGKLPDINTFFDTFSAATIRVDIR